MRAAVGAVLVAAGSSRRMGFDKVWALLGGRPVVRYALDGLVSSPLVDRLVVVVGSDRVDDVVREVASMARAEVCVGGARRRDSVRAGLELLGDCEWILVHDAARPFLSHDLVERGLAAAQASGAAIAAVPMRDTVKRVEAGIVVETLDRTVLWSVQTPQVFRRSLLERALAASDEDVSDEAVLVERLGGRVAVYLGSECNQKLTTAADFALAEARLAAAAAGRGDG